MLSRAISLRVLKVGETIIAECIYEDAVRIKAGEFTGLAVSTEVAVLQSDGVTRVEERIFDKSTDVIALRLKPC